MRGARALLVAASISPLAAQQAVDSTNLYERMYCVVPVVAAKGQPSRPMYAPAPGAISNRAGMLGFVSMLSDDGRFSLVEFVAGDRAAFQPILAEKRSDVKCFDKGKAKKADIEAEFRKYRRDFSFDRFAVRVP